MDLGVPDAPYQYVCPMHPDVIGEESERCPKCGMKLLPAELVAETSERGAHAHEGHGHAHGKGHSHVHQDAPERVNELLLRFLS